MQSVWLKAIKYVASLGVHEGSAKMGKLRHASSVIRHQLNEIEYGTPKPAGKKGDEATSESSNS